MTTTDRWLAFLQSHVGEVESPSGSNCCPTCQAYGSLGGTRCYAWCCALQDLATEATFGSRLLQTAAVGQAMANAKARLRGLIWVPRSEVESGQTPIRIGDLPCYDYGGRGNWNDMHIEGVVNPSTQVRFQTIGGNRQNRCDYWWNTLSSKVMGFVRLPFDQVGLGPSQEETDLVSAAELIQEMHNAMFGDPKTPGTGLQDRVAHAEHEAQTAREQAATAAQLAKSNSDALKDIASKVDKPIDEVRVNLRTLMGHEEVPDKDIKK